MKKRIIHIHIIIDKVASQSVRRGSTIISVFLAILVTFPNDYLLFLRCTSDWIPTISDVSSYSIEYRMSLM